MKLVSLIFVNGQFGTEGEVTKQGRVKNVFIIHVEILLFDFHLKKGLIYDRIYQPLGFPPIIISFGKSITIFLNSKIRKYR